MPLPIFVPLTEYFWQETVKSCVPIRYVVVSRVHNEESILLSYTPVEGRIVKL